MNLGSQTMIDQLIARKALLVINRLPCVSCIMGPKGDIARGALARPELFARHVEPGQRTGHTMHMSRKPLTQPVAEAQPNPLPLAA